MSIKFNKKGMTLVEITVVLLIASILMTITGGILINSLGYFQDTTALSTDKSVGDGVLDFINSEIEYSSDVRVQENQPNGNDWHCIYVENGQLYRDGKAVFDEDYYYNKRKLEINVNGFKNGYRLDMKIYLKKNNEIKYRTSHTFEFLNLKKTKKADSTYNPFNNVLSKVSVVNEINTEKDNEKYRIWYKRDYSEIKPEEDKKDEPTDTDQTRDGTVADIKYKINIKNYRGIFKPGIANSYRKGEIVWYENNWWQKTAITGGQGGYNTAGPGHAFGWKKLTSEYSAPVIDGIYSSYNKGDIVIYDGNYYEANMDIEQNDPYSSSNTWHRPVKEWSDGSWKLLGSVDDKNVVEYVKSHKYGENGEYDIYTFNNILNKYLTDESYLNDNNVLLDPNKGDFKEFDKNTFYNDGDIVKMKNKDDSSFYDLWVKKIHFGKGLKAPGTVDSGWVKIDYDWSADSSYVAGDIVYYGQNSIDFMKVVRDVDYSTNPSNFDYFYGWNNTIICYKKVDMNGKEEASAQ